MLENKIAQDLFLDIVQARKNLDKHEKLTPIAPEDYKNINLYLDNSELEYGVIYVN